MPANADVVPLLIHGFLDKGAAWAAFIDELGPLSERALAPDFAGAGARARAAGPFTLRRQEADAIGVIDEQPNAQFVVVGHSSGKGRSPYAGPALLVAARKDPVISVEMVLSLRESRFPGSKFAIVEESGHWPHLEQPRSLARAIRGFLSGRGLA